MNNNARRAALLIALAVAGFWAPGCNWGGKSNAQRPSDPPLAHQKFDLVKEPDINASTRLAAGKLAESRGDWGMAIKQYEAALHAQPRDPRALHHLAAAYTMTGQFDQAESLWLRYIEATGRSADAYNNLAQCYEYAKRPADAEKAYRSAIAADPRNVFARTNFGLMLVREGRVDQGREQMAAVLPPAEVHYNVASVLELQGNKTLARSEYLRALEKDPQMSDARKRLASME